MKKNSDIGIKRGARIKYLRTIAGLKRDELAKMISVSGATLSYWENASFSELTDKGANKIINALEKIGIECSTEWLLFGIGKDPSTIISEKNSTNFYDDKKMESTKLSDEDNPFYSKQNEKNSIIENEIKLFLTIPDSQVIQITSKSLSPILEPGMLIGIVWMACSDFYLNKQRTCVIEYDNQLEARKIDAMWPNNEYDLSYLNYSSDHKTPFSLKKLKLNKIASIVRVWELFPTYHSEFLQTLQKTI